MMAAFRAETIDETHLSTEQARAQAPSWVPRENGDDRRPQGHRGPSRPRAEAAERLSGRLDPRPAATTGLAVERLKNRAEFRAVAGGTRVSRTGFVLQALKAGADHETRPPRFGFTVTKKIGNAVVRNRIRRRLREVARLAGGGETGTDYVLIGRRAALTLEFERLKADLMSGFAQLTRAPRPTTSPADAR